jgi:hypothetical protein
MAMIIPGMDVVNLLRAHIAYEREMLGRITEFGKPTKSPAGKKKTARRAKVKKTRHAAKWNSATKGVVVLPYTLEPHPEL